MVNRRHTLVLSPVDEAGDTSTSEVPCRYEPSQTRFIPGQDGEQIVYQGIAYLGRDLGTVAIGTNVEVKDGEESIATGTVKLFSRGLFNARIWL